MRTPEEIAAIIDRYNLADRDALRELEAHIRRELPIREILLFADFLHDGDFISSSGKWRRNSSGYVTQTDKEDAALTCLWEGLARSAHFYIGAASVLKMQNARLFAGYAFADEGDGPTLYDYTLDALVRAVPKEYHNQLDAASRLDDIKKTAIETRQGVGVLVQHLPDANLKAQDMRRRLDQLTAQGDRIEGKVGDLPKGLKAAAKEGAKVGVEGTLPKVYAKAANMSDEELAKLSKPKTRSSGGGRKKERDLGENQVKAALKYADNHPDIGLRAACDHIVRTMKESDFKKPYMTAKDLDAAVRRYCKKTSRRIPSKARSGRWSAKS